MRYTPEQRQKLREDCELIVPGFAEPSAAEEFKAMGEWCALHGVEHDHYGEGKVLGDFEQKIASLLGKPAAVFMPSGIMAQSAAVKIWTETAHLPRFGMHPTSHLAAHEEEAWSALLHCHGVLIGDRLRPMLAKDLDASPQPMACVIVELPIREAGGQLPSWDELEALKATARARGIRLHMDGARLWESAASYSQACGKSHAQIAAGFDSVYVSLYKGVGAFAGAMLAGPEDFIAQARLWRRRMGGTLHHLSPMVVSAAMRFDERLALMPALYARTLELAAGLRDACPSLRVNPTVPHTNMFHLYFPAPVDEVIDARDAIAAQARCWLFGGVRTAEVPGWSMCEVNIGDRLLQADNARVMPLFAQFADALRAS